MSVKSKSEKEVVSLYLPVELMNRARAISQETGVPISRMAERGLEKELKRYEAIKVLEGTEDR